MIHHLDKDLLHRHSLKNIQSNKKKMYKSFYGTLLAINKDTAWHHIKEEGLSLEKYFHALFILKPLLDKVQYWLESNFIVCKCS